MSYSEYLKSEHWRDFKKRYRASKNPQRCMVCNCKEVDLHHITYKRIENEQFSDVIPLCMPHHRKVHEILRQARRPVEETDWALDRIRSSIQQKQERKLSRRQEEHIARMEAAKQAKKERKAKAKAKAMAFEEAARAKREEKQKRAATPVFIRKAIPEFPARNQVAGVAPARATGCRVLSIRPKRR